MTWTWEWQAHPEAWLAAAALEAGYLGCLAVLGPRYGGAERRPVTGRKVVLFTLGALTIWVASDWPVHDLAEGLYGAHMLQHVLLALVAPPLLLLGVPGWLARLALRPRPAYQAARALTRPVPALLVFNAVLALAHWPPVVELMSRSETAHLALHAALVGSAFMMWMPVLSPTEELPRLSPAGTMFYLLAQAALPMFLASLLSLSRLPIYLPYGAGPRFFGLSPVLDQRIAGAVMGAGGLAVGLMGVVIWVRGEPAERLPVGAGDPGEAGNGAGRPAPAGLP